MSVGESTVRKESPRECTGRRIDTGGETTCKERIVETAEGVVYGEECNVYKVDCEEEGQCGQG